VSRPFSGGPTELTRPQDDTIADAFHPSSSRPYEGTLHPGEFKTSTSKDTFSHWSVDSVSAPLPRSLETSGGVNSFHQLESEETVTTLRKTRKHKPPPLDMFSSKPMPKALQHLRNPRVNAAAIVHSTVQSNSVRHDPSSITMPTTDHSNMPFMSPTPSELNTGPLYNTIELLRYNSTNVPFMSPTPSELQTAPLYRLKPTIPHSINAPFLSPTPSELQTAPLYNRNIGAPSPMFFSPQTPVAMNAFECPLVYSPNPPASQYQEESEQRWRTEKRNSSGPMQIRMPVSAPKQPQSSNYNTSSPSSNLLNMENLNRIALVQRASLTSDIPDPIDVPEYQQDYYNNIDDSSEHHTSWDQSSRSESHHRRKYIPSMSSANGKQAILQSYFQNANR
jgi:hypothetical protein